MRLQVKHRRHRFYYLLALSLSVYWFLPLLSTAQAPQPVPLVIEGGTLIDGNGGTPVRDSVIIIQGNRIASVTQKGKLPYPANAQVIKADGKFILPGYWDARVNHVWFLSEALLLNGITSVIDMGTGAELSMIYRDAVEHGKISGPRTFIGIGFISARPYTVQQFLGTGFETSLTPGRVPKSAEDAREITKRLLAGNPDMVVIQDGALPVEYDRAIAEEAHKAGKPVFGRPHGPNVDPKAGVLAGINTITHSGDGLGLFVTKDPSKWNNDAVDAWSDVDEAKAAELTKLFLQQKTVLEPNLIQDAPGLSDKWAHWELEDRRMFSNVNLRAYFPEDRIASALGILNARPPSPEDRERRYKGMMNAVRFHHRYVQGGGHVVIGSDSPTNATVGKGFHHEAEILADGGFTPMEIIQAATKWPAESANALSRVGTIEAGKLADIVIIDQDPLQDIKNLQTIHSVIFNGKPVELQFHPWYRTPFLGNSPNSSPPVDGLPWAMLVKKATIQPESGGAPKADSGGVMLSGNNKNCGSYLVYCDADENSGRERLPPPGIETISPYIVTEGSPTVTLTLKGFNFFARSLVYFDNIPVPYRRVSGTELQVTLDENYLKRVGRFEIKVKNSPPLSYPELGDGTSNKAYLIVNYKY